MSDIKSKYIIVEHKDDPDQYGIALTEEKYKGIIYAYGKVDMRPENFSTENPEANLNFEYTVFNNPTDIVIAEDAELQQLMGEILVTMIKDVMEQNEQHRENNTEGSEG